MADSVDPGDTPAKVEILGFGVDALPRPDVVAWIEKALRDPRGGRCRHIVTLNPEYIMASRRNTSFARALNAADLTTADGIGVAVAARLLHGVSIERITGVEIMEMLAGLSSSCSAPVFLLGAGPGVAEAAAKRLSGRFPRARIAGSWADGTPDPRDDQLTLRMIAESGANVVAVAYGAPGQVLWIERNRAALAASGVRLAIGVGGAFDYLSGLTPRPPGFIRRIGMEWLFRLAREPRRWRRQLVLPAFAIRVLVATVNGRIRKRRSI